MSQVVRIVPAPMGETDIAHRTSGTKVLLPDGSELPGVAKIILTAEPGDIWRAEIHCHAIVDGVVADAQIMDVTLVRDSERNWMAGKPADEHYPPMPRPVPPAPQPCECKTHCMHAKITQSPLRPGRYCRERAAG
jgi:hypothetical protein